MNALRDLTIPTVLLLDVETSGLYRNDLTMADEGQPWAIEIAAALCTPAGAMTNFFSHIIKADGRKIKEGALNVHGISDRAASQVGVAESRVLGLLTDMLKTASLQEMKVVTYGDLDRKVIASLLARYAIFLRKSETAFDQLWWARPGVQFIDIQKPYAQQLCKLPSDFEDKDFRWPTLDEAAEIIAGHPRRPAGHDAFTDLIMLKDVYFECARRGLISEPAVSPP